MHEKTQNEQIQPNSKIKKIEQRKEAVLNQLKEEEIKNKEKEEKNVIKEQKRKELLERNRN